MITITWHVLLLIVIIVALLIFAFTRDNSNEGCVEFWLSLLIAFIIILIYGGIFWW